MISLSSIGRTGDSAARSIESTGQLQARQVSHVAIREQIPLRMPRRLLPNWFSGILTFLRTQSPLIADILKELIASGSRHVWALRRETAVKYQGLSCVIG